MSSIDLGVAGDRNVQLLTIKEVFQEDDWLTAEEIGRLQGGASKAESPSFISDWKRSGRVFSVSYEGRDYYARYQFDSLYQPLPVIKDVLDAYGPYADSWVVAAWFHFPNAWIAEEQSVGTGPVSPKNALHRRSEVINAARNRKMTYIA